MTLCYHVTALQMPIYFNSVRLDAGATCKADRATIVGGHHDHSGMMYALTANVPILKYIRALIENETPTVDLTNRATARAIELKMLPLPTTRAQATLPHLLVRPLVLRARYKETVRIEFCNEIKGRRVGMHLVADGYDVKTSDGSAV